MIEPKKETVIFGGGCFWCTEAIFKELKGVISVTPGYAGGSIENPTYEQVCSGKTGHAEVIKVEFDPLIIKFKDLLKVFFATHDPTTMNKQGHDVGTQYRSVIFTTNPSQESEIKEAIANINDLELFESPIVTKVEPLTNFYDAEDYHKDYYAKNPTAGYCQMVISPKMAKFRSSYNSLIKNESH